MKPTSIGIVENRQVIDLQRLREKTFIALARLDGALVKTRVIVDSLKRSIKDLGGKEDGRKVSHGG